MTYRPPFLSRLNRSEKGATALEFGLILLPLCVLLMGGIDIGYQVYVRSVVTGALEAAARATTIENANYDTIKTRLENAVHDVMPSAHVDIVKGSFYSYSQISSMERLTKDTDGDNVLDSGDCWEDVDNNGIRNIVTTGKDGIGSADDIVRYNVTASYHRLLPIYRIFGIGETATVSATTLVKRQPYAGQSSPPTLCKA